MKFELMIDNNGKIQLPLVADGLTWTTERVGVPGKLSFTVIKDDSADFQEGNSVILRVDNVNVFYGFVFTKKRDKQHHISVTAYDQLRYLMNKDTIIYRNKTASDVLRMVANDCKLQLGTIEQTSFNITQRSEDNKTYFDIFLNALALEGVNTGRAYTLYDDFGKLTLKPLDSMYIADLLIDAETAENFDYQSTIDDRTYNKINLSYENEETGKRDRYVMFDSNNIGKWGVLQYHEELQNGENGAAKAAALLKKYNAKTRKLKITRAFGDLRVRGGSLIFVRLMLGDGTVSGFMMVEKCVHTFNESEHFMDLTLIGDEFDG